MSRACPRLRLLGARRIGYRRFDVVYRFDILDGPRPLRCDADGLTALPRARTLASIVSVIRVGIGVAWTLVLAIRIRIVERAITGFRHHLLRRSWREAYRVELPPRRVA